MCSTDFGINIIVFFSLETHTKFVSIVFCFLVLHLHKVKNVSDILFITHANALNHARMLEIISLQNASCNYVDVRACDTHWKSHVTSVAVSSPSMESVNSCSASYRNMRCWLAVPWSPTDYIIAGSSPESGSSPQHSQQHLFIAVSRPIMHCSCPSFLLFIVTLVFWPSTPKPAAW